MLRKDRPFCRQQKEDAECGGSRTASRRAVEAGKETPLRRRSCGRSGYEVHRIYNLPVVGQKHFKILLGVLACISRGMNTPCGEHRF